MEKIKNTLSLLVLGGTGFIGKHIINKAAAKGWDVTSASLSLPLLKAAGVASSDGFFDIIIWFGRTPIYGG